jgi:hypothetical protein
MAALAVAAFALIMYLGRGIDFYFDEWSFILARRGHSLDAFLKPHNEHIVLVPVILYKVLLAVVGLGHHWPYLAMLALMHVALGVGVYLLASRRLGGWAGVIAATLILFMGLAWQNMLWSFQIGFVGSVLGGVWAWVALDRRDGRGDVLACLALVLGTASSSLGIPLAVGVGAEIVVQRRWRALWVALVPVVLYGLWYLGYGVSDVTGEGVFHAVAWAVTAVTAAAGAMFGVGTDWGRTLVILGVLVLGWRTALLIPSARLVGLLTGGIAFWLLTGAARSVFQPPVPPETSRYLTLGAVVLLLAAVELARGLRPPPALLVYAALIALVAVALGLPTLRDNARQLRTFGTLTEAELGALELSAARAPAGYPPDASTTPQLRAGPYFAAVKDYGSSPADSPGELAAAAPADRAQADRVLQEINVRLQPSTTKGQACRVARPVPGKPAIVTATVPAAGIVVRALGDQPADLRLRRFGDGFANGSLGLVPKAQPQLLRMPPDASPRPYVAQAQSAGPVALCAAG